MSFFGVFVGIGNVVRSGIQQFDTVSLGPSIEKVTKPNCQDVASWGVSENGTVEVITQIGGVENSDPVRRPLNYRGRGFWSYLKGAWGSDLIS